MCFIYRKRSLLEKKKKENDVTKEGEMQLEDIQTLNKQADKSRRDQAEEETVGEAMSPDQAGTTR